MGGKKKRNRQAAAIAQENAGQIRADQNAAQSQYDADLQGLRDFEVSDFYADLAASNIDLNALSQIDPRQFQGQAAQADVAQMGAIQQGQVGQLGSAQGYTGEGYTAAGTNVGPLARGADTGLSNVFNNLQVSTAGSDLAAREADQSLAASQDLLAQTGGGGATALAAAAAKSKAGISADIDRQVKANEVMRAQGEQSLQRDLLSQGNLASQFDLGQQQFNVGAQNQAAQFGANARNQAAQFGAGAANQFALSQFGAENAMSQFNAGQQNTATQAVFGAQNQANQFNASQSNAERMAAYNAATQADAANAATINNALAQNASNQTNFDLSQAAGQSQAQSNQYDVQANLMDVSTNTLSEIDAKDAENQAVIDLGKMSKKGIFSDRRLKKNIKLIGKSNSGINIYLFEYINKLLGEGIFQGVMSDEIPIHAVVKHSSGYDWVDYSLLDVEFKSLT